MTTVTDWLRAAPNAHDLDYEFKRQAAIRDWCLRQIGVREGDRVRLTVNQVGDHQRQSGWWGYRECLVAGATATVTSVEFNPHSDNWQATIRLDREWAVDGDKGITRWWHGTVDTTPEGYSPPGEYEQKNYPDGRRHVFSIAVDDLERVRPDYP